MRNLCFFSVVFFFLLNYPSFSGSFIIKFKKDSPNELVKEYLSNSDVHLSEMQFSKVVRTTKSKIKALGQNLLTTNLVDNLLGYYVIEIPDSSSTAILYKIWSFPEIDFVEPNFKISIEQDNMKDTDFQKQWYIDFVRAREAWKKSTGKGIRVGIIDTGIDFDHNDLKNRIWINPKEDINHTGRFEPWPDSVKVNGVTGDLNGIDDDGNGFTDDVIGYDFVNQTYGNLGDYSIPDPIPFDEHGHGTMVAGVIGADINGIGIVGIAPEVKIVALRAFDLTGNAEIKDIANAIIYAALNGINVLNLSFGSQEYSRLLEDAISFAQSMGCIVVASAGNDGSIIPHYPSDFDGVISVGSITSEGVIANSSNFGPNVDIFAPGVQIYTASPNNSYRYISGTSFSAPIVAGGCALLLAMDSTLKEDQIVGILKATQKNLPGKGARYSHGYVDFAEAIDFLGTSLFEIRGIQNDDEFLKEVAEDITVQIFAYSPFFLQYNLYLYKDDSILFQKIIEHSNEQSLGNSIKLNIADLDEGKYTLKLIVNLRNGNQIEKSVRFFVSSRDSSLQLESVDFVSSIYENREFDILETRTNLPTFCKVSILKDGKEVLQLSDETYSQSHFIPLLGIENFASSPLSVTIRYTTKSGKEVNYHGETHASRYYNSNSFSPKYNTLPLSYLFGVPVPFNSPVPNSLLLNPYNDLNWENLELYQFVDSGFTKVAELGEPWIPVDTGDSNGDGKFEILTTLLGKTKLFQPGEDSQHYFNTILFQSKPGTKLWATKMKDIDRNGKDALICYNDTSIQIVGFKNGMYETIYQITPPDSFGIIGTKPNIQIADFDSDGNSELAFFTTRGYLLIYEFDRITQIFRLEYSLKTEGDPLSISTSIGKLKPNQNYSLFFVQSKDFEDKAYREHKGSLWKLFRVEANSKDTYSATYLKSFFGVRTGSIPQGIFYRNGLVAGNIDSDDGDELLLSLFPNFYILKLDTNEASFSPILWIPFVYSNSVIVYDFNSNGINEFGIANWDGLHFYELNVRPKLLTPSFLDGWLDTMRKVNLNWGQVENADKYGIFELLPNGNLNLLGVSYSNDFTFEVTDPPNIIDFTVRAISDSGNFEPSDFTTPKRIYFITPTQPFSIEVISPKQIEIQFIGKLPLVFRNKSVIQVYDTNQNAIEVATIQRANDSILVLTFNKKLELGKYLVQIESFRDYWGNLTTSRTLSFEINSVAGVDTLLFVQKFEFITENKIILHFNSELDSISATNPVNYRIEPFGQIVELKLGSNAFSIEIELNSNINIISLGIDFYLILGKIYSKDLNKVIAPPFNTIALTRELQEISQVFVYPNPLNLAVDEQLTFANIPSNSIVEVYNGYFHKILELKNERWKGGIQFDLSNYNGYSFESGIYYFRVRKLNKDGTETISGLKKFAIVR